MWLYRAFDNVSISRIIEALQETQRGIFAEEGSRRISESYHRTSSLVCAVLSPQTGMIPMALHGKPLMIRISILGLLYLLAKQE